ncbi:Tyrosine-protein kinase ITK/TSK [Trichinella spiralis]|uniref:Tyrosine-protein kinase ITK/TSK n=1 Tax=Trichinella spiralis TaxID=6334 RepID=A0ABR3KCD7_TRISP
MIDHRVNFPFHTQLPFEIRLKLLCSDENLSNLHKTLERRALACGPYDWTGNACKSDSNRRLDAFDQSQETAVSS